MAASPISPIAPARIRALVVPVDRLRRSRFDSFVDRLCSEHVIRLGDISPDQRPDRTFFSPLAFPNGVILYNFITTTTLKVQEDLFPFELFRMPMLVIGVTDSLILESQGPDESGNPAESPAFSNERISELENGLRNQFPYAPCVQLMIFDSRAKQAPGEVMLVPPKSESRTTTMKTIMCDVSAKVLAEMAIMAKTIQIQEHVASPGSVETKTTSAGVLTRHSSLRESVLSGGSKKSSDRASSPVGSRERTNSAGDERSSRRMSSPASSALPPSFQRRERSKSPLGDNMSPPRVTNHSTADLRDKPRDAGVSRVRDSSRNRHSLHSPPSISPDERAKNILRLRQGIVIGTLYLMAGRWADALRDLVDNTTRAKVFGDHAWFAKGLENILTTMLLLAWAHMDFSVPPICFSNSERSSSLKHIPSSNLIRSSQSIDSNDGQPSRILSNLSLVIPDMVQNILLHYRRADGTDSEPLPQFPYSESVIRLSVLSTVIQRVGGELIDHATKHLVIGSPPLPTNRLSQRSSPGVQTLKFDIAALVFQALPSEHDALAMPTVDLVTVLAGIISVLSLARFYRKRAMIIRESMSMLIPRLIQARKVGAAEMGIHPAASLAAVHGLTIDSTSGAPILDSRQKDIEFHDLLVALCETFGVPGVVTARSASDKQNSRQMSTVKSENAIRQELLQQSFGAFELKSEVLRLCSNFSESLPDFHDVVTFTSALLKSAGAGSAPSRDIEAVSNRLSREEQLRFATKINRTLSVFKAEDAAKLESDYWDPFLVRDVSISDTRSSRVGSTSGDFQKCNMISDLGQFKSGPTTGTGRILTTLAPNSFVVNEPTEFSVMLQNLYDFEIRIESLKFLTSGVDIETTSESFVIPARSLQRSNIQAVARESGDCNLHSCAIKVQGCREQQFELFPGSWTPKDIIKVKASGLNALRDVADRPTSSKSDSKQLSAPVIDLPSPLVRAFKAVAPQPKLTLKTMSLPQGSVDLIEGESRIFSLCVQNVSSAVDVNFLSVSFDYEIDGETRRKRAPSGSSTLRHLELLSLRETTASLDPISAGRSAALNLDIQGQLGLVKANIHIDYARLNEPVREEAKSLPTRRLTVPLVFSVHASLRLDALNIAPHRDQLQDFPLSESRQAHGAHDSIIAADICNIWLSPLSIELSAAGVIPSTPQTLIEAGQSSRLFIPFSHTQTGHQTIPTNQQPDLAQWTVHWKDPASDRHGMIQLDSTLIRGVLGRVSPPKPVRVDFSLAGRDGARAYEADGAFHIAVEHLAVLTIKVKNTSTSIQNLVIRLKPGFASPTTNSDVSRHLAWTGALRHGAPELGPGDTRDVRLGVCPLSCGKFVVEVVATTVESADQLGGGVIVIVAGPST